MFDVLLFFVMCGLLYLMYREQYVLKKDESSNNIKSKNKYSFGNFVVNPTSTYSFYITTTQDIPSLKINNIFMYNSAGIKGVSAVCTLIAQTDGIKHHYWKLYADDQYAQVIQDVAREINSCYVTI